MLKVRLMGTENDIEWFKRVLKKNPEVEVSEFSDTYENKGTNQYYRAYAEVEKSGKKKSKNVTQ